MPDRVHGGDARKFLLGLTTLIVIALIGWVGTNMQLGGGLPVKQYTHVTAAFHDVGWLRPRLEVTYNGVRIGAVESINHRGEDAAMVTMRLDGKRELYRDARASVGNASALGRKYIAIDPGTPGAGPLGNRTITTSRTNDSLTLDDVYSGLDIRTRGALRSSLRELGGGLLGRGNDLRDFIRTSSESLRSVGQISSTVADQKTRFPELLRSANQLAGTFRGHEHEIASLLDNMNATFQALNVDGGKPLEETFQSLPPTLRTAKRGLDSLNEPLINVHSAVSAMRPGVEALGHSANDLRGLLREGVAPMQQVPGVSEQAIPAVDELTHTLTDARPLASQLPGTFTSANVLLQGLAPYAPDIGRWASEHDLLSGQVAPGKHHISFMLVMPGTYMASLSDPAVERVPYPEPGGGAWRDNPSYDPSTGGGR